MLQTMKLTTSEARTIIEAAVASAAHDGLRLSIAVVDAGGALLAFERMDGASPMAADISIVKARSSAASGLSTAFLADVLTAMPVLAGLPHFVGAAGGVPVLHAGECIGAVGASGGTAVQDAKAAEDGLARLQSLSQWFR